MRDQYQLELSEISAGLIEMADAVCDAMRRATTALLECDGELANQVVTDDANIDALYRAAEERVFLILARQTPVASDLRLVLTSLHVAGDLERMGDLAEHIARTARRRLPECAVPPSLLPAVREMGDVANRMACKIGPAITARDPRAAAELEHDDDVMDALHRSLFQVMFDDGWNHGPTAAVDLALLGRYYERYADHAVNVARHIVFMVTANHPPKPVAAR